MKIMIRIQIHILKDIHLGNRSFDSTTIDVIIKKDTIINAYVNNYEAVSIKHENKYYGLYASEYSIIND